MATSSEVLDRFAVSPLMMDWRIQSAISIAAAFAYAVLVRPLLQIRSRGGVWISTLVAVGVLFSPLLVDAQWVRLRALSAFLSIELLFKMVDYARECRRHEEPIAASIYYKFLIPFPNLLVVLRDSFKRRSDRSGAARDIARIVVGLALFGSGFWLLHLTTLVPVFRESFALDHGVKLLIFIMAIEALAQAVHSIERLLGCETRSPMRWIFLSRTVAEFWYRYNTRVHDWLDRNVFRPSGGRRAPRRGVFLVFLVSGVFHEVMFAMATSRLDGYQLSFFLLQTLGVYASPALNRLARNSPLGRFLAHTTTFAFFYFTTMLFFHGVNRVFPIFYASTPWLP